MKCPICGWVGPEFSPGPKSEQFCPKCKSRARHRHIRHALAQYKLLSKIRGAEVLCVGCSQVEVNIFNGAKIIERISKTNPNHGSVMLDLANLHLFRDSQFDFLLACHVLEHVQKLSKGIEEAYRVLKPGGAAIFCVPISRRKKSIMRAASDRMGHWWLVGDDWDDCYVAAGFSVAASMGHECPASFGVKPNNKISICKRA